jgi:hypothetical protein
MQFITLFTFLFSFSFFFLFFFLDFSPQRYILLYVFFFFFFPQWEVGGLSNFEYMWIQRHSFFVAIGMLRVQKMQENRRKMLLLVLYMK